MNQLQIRTSTGRRVRSLVTKPLKAIGRRLLRWFGFRAPFPMMFSCFYGYLFATSAYVVAKLAIPDLLKDGPKSTAELAKLTETDEPTLFRIMRALASLNVFDEVDSRVFALTPLGEMLQSDKPDSLYYWALHFGEDMLPVLPAMLNQAKTGEQAFTKAHGMPLWDYLSEDEEQGVLWDKKMSVFTEQHVASIVKAYDFSSVGLLADVGGGRGALITEILKANPSVRGILFDRPQVTPEAEERIAQAGLSERCSVVSGSFLECVPPEAEAYIFKHVFHDWDDENVLKILRNCREVMSEGDKLFIVEGFVEHDIFGLDEFRRWCDVYQMLCLLGKERTLDEMRGLLAKAGFEMRSLTPTSLMDVSILETIAVKEPQEHPSAAAKTSTPLPAELAAADTK
jgi:hypothetical protein